jgi:O-succinylbenzoic acid--CoA ligase
VEEAHLIDWESSDSHVLLNPRMPDEERRGLEKLVRPMPAHIWLSTSGTSGRLKLVALSKAALLASAAAVNRHLDAERSDVWCCVLPTFHVGGLGIFARAFLSGAKVVSAAWDPRAFASLDEMTLASLVPAQVRDLLNGGFRPPRKLRAIVVGGGVLTGDIYERARSSGWPVLPSYGMTELCSQVATARQDSQELVLLDHLEARVDEDSRLSFRGASLLTGYGTEEGFVDPKIDGWFRTEDVGSIEGRRLTIAGRAGDFVKIGGESVDLTRLDRILAAISPLAAVTTLLDERLGHVIVLAVEGGEPHAIEAAFNARVHPFERARKVLVVERIPRTELGKIIRSQLTDLFA